MTGLSMLLLFSTVMNVPSRVFPRNGENPQLDLVLGGEPDRGIGSTEPRLASPHLPEADGIEFASDNARGSAGDAVHVGVDLAFVRPSAAPTPRRWYPGAAAAEGGDIAVRVHALEAGDHHHPARVEVLGSAPRRYQRCAPCAPSR